MYKEILYKNQLEIIWVLKLFSNNFYLAWWTSIALHLWHRKSIDFDLFSNKEIKNSEILNKLKTNWYKIDRILIDNKWEELTIISSWVKLTFLYYPFSIKLEKEFEWIQIPSLEILCAMKFYTLWRRWKWKDYIDIYTILNSWYNLNNISKIAEKIFEWWYNEKLLREQLCYFDDIDYTEDVDYLWQNIDNEKVKNFLCNIAIS
jgi:predicted nucleotidyltransferase component of viral defense system